MSELLDSVTADGTLELRLRDSWRIDRIGEIERDLLRVPVEGLRVVNIDTSALRALDLGPAALLRDRLQAIAATGAQVRFSTAVPDSLQFVATLYERTAAGEPPAVERGSWLAQALHRVGEGVISQMRELLNGVAFFGQLAVTFLRAITSVHRMRVPSVARHVYETGVLAIPCANWVCSSRRSSSLGARVAHSLRKSASCG